MNELPTMMSSTYASNTVNPSTFLVAPSVTAVGRYDSNWQAKAISNFGHLQSLQAYVPPPHPSKKEISMTKILCRVVKVFIADPDENVPLEDRLLYSGAERLTDLTDEELFFEVDIKGILATHNEKRVKLVNKAVKERVEYLGPVRIRDLRMTVVNVATF